MFETIVGLMAIVVMIVKIVLFVYLSKQRL